MAALLTDQYRIFSAQKFIKALEGPDATQSHADAGSRRGLIHIDTSTGDIYIYS